MSQKKKKSKSNNYASCGFCQPLKWRFLSLPFANGKALFSSPRHGSQTRPTDLLTDKPFCCFALDHWAA
ncbi:UNVERIFIED_CONTAM: hypothetical protein K2H54_017937 [Gekko kuhli]